MNMVKSLRTNSNFAKIVKHNVFCSNHAHTRVHSLRPYELDLRVFVYDSFPLLIADGMRAYSPSLPLQAMIIQY